MHDVVIIGAGPAGLTLGCYLADAGVSCLIIDRANHPRPHVGESLMPASVRVLREIGFHDLVETAGFPHSGGIVYHPSRGRPVALPYSEFPQEGVNQDYTYHVDRARFDMLLLKHAENLGCRVVEGVTVEEMVLDASGAATGVRASIGGSKIDIPARIVVDAAGRSTRIGRQLGLRKDSSVLDQFALHGWFTGIDRRPERMEAYTHIFFLPDIRGWAWQSPIDDAISSLGLVTARSAYLEADDSIEDYFTNALRGNEALEKATRHAHALNELKGEINYSYRLERICGDGWLAVGDAARFIDPVFSSGVTIALQGARFAAERIVTALEASDTTRAALEPYERHIFENAEVWDDFVETFYRLLPAFTHLLETTRNREALTRMIQGDISKGSNERVLDEMRTLANTVEATP